MKSKSFVSLFMLMFVLLMSSVASSAPTLVSPSPNSFGEIERITLNTPADIYSGGILVVGGVEMILPKNLLIDLPANRLSLQQIFAQAPAACKALGESGLAKADRCNGTGSGGIATLSAVRTNAGNVIVGDLFIQKAAESVHGVVTYINYDQGYYRVNGLPNDPATGAMVRLNDPNSRHTIQSGAGCAGGLNCSPDPRFNLDPDNYTNTFATGYPVCIPSTVTRNFTNPLGAGGTTSKANADGTGDFLCPDSNRTNKLVEDPVADSRRFAPIKVGDSVVAEGNFEAVGGVRFLSAHSSTVQKALTTRNIAGQPDYLFLEEVGYEAPPYQNQRLIALLIGFSTLTSTDVDVWSLHRDPVNNAIHEFPFATVRGCDAAQGGPGNCSSQGLVAAGANIFKIRYDVDFLLGPQPKLSPCAHLSNPASRFATSHPGICGGAASTAKDIAVMSPVPHEIIARTGRKIDSATNPAIGTLITIDVNGNPATNGEYLFPLGLNLGGLGVAEMSEVNINELFTPIPFEGITWNLDRRLGPSGCLNAGGCEAGAVGSAAFALDPFPFSGLDPRLQASLLPNVSYIDPVFSPTTLTSSRDRMFSYVSGNNFGGNATVMPYALGTFPADPPLIPIIPTPLLNIYPPIADEDAATTTTGVAVVINVLANDFPVFGSIDPASVLIATGPASGNVFVNPTTGAITYTPTNPLISTVSFSYTVANNFGSRSLPASVTVTINAPPPVANNDTASTTTGTPVVINVIANDTTAVSTLNPASLSVTAPTGGTASAKSDGKVTYTPPATPGTYTFAYTVKNNAVSPATSNVATVTVTVTQGAPASAVTLVSTLPSPQNPGASVTFVAAGSGGSGNYEYRFWLNTGGGWAVVQNYSTNATWTWNTTSVPIGFYPVQVDVRNVGSTTTTFEAAKSISYTLAAPAAPASAVTLASTLASPQVPGASIAFVAAGSGGSGNYEYRFWLKTGAVWSVVQNYSPSATWTWITTGLAPGPYVVQVDARNVGSTIATFEAAKAITYTLVAPAAPASAVTLAQTLASPQTAGASIAFVAAGSGGSGNYEYRFWLKTGTVWSVVQNYSTTATWTWNTTGAIPGIYGIQVDVRNVGSTTSPYEAAKAIVYTIQ